MNTTKRRWRKRNASRGGTAVGYSMGTDTDMFPIPPTSEDVGSLGGIS
jgi:hypothetical protein